MDTELVLQNPHATMPLRVKLDLICNTPAEKILSNVIENSKLSNEWISQVPAHDGVALICGSGYSIADCLDEIGVLKAAGAKIFALNGAASYLYINGFMPDYQVIMDAQPRTIELVGRADKHLFASQVDPALFAAKPDALLWHATYGNFAVDEQEDFPKREADYCLIGGAFSVGNTAMVLAFAMGYRNIHVFGMDSSNRGDKSHVRHQPINDDDVYTFVEHRGVRYTCSLTMKLQADNFVPRAKALMKDGCKITVHGSGLLPALWNNPLSEKEKYETMWRHDDYRNDSPGEDCIDKFLAIARPTCRIIDFGCGTGRAALTLSRFGYHVLLADFATNCRDQEAMKLPFVECDLTKPLDIEPVVGDVGFCTDVMEHIPPENVDKVINNIMDCVGAAFFQISTVPDNFGSVIGHALHLTVEDYTSWLSRFNNLGYDVRWSQNNGSTVLFYITRKGV